MKRRFRRQLSAMLVAMMLLNMGMHPVFVQASSVDTSVLTECHAQHDNVCGYTESKTEGVCNHEHDGECGYVQGTAENPCTFTQEADTGGSGQDAVEEPDTETPDALHSHDDACGYAPATEDSPCIHQHNDSCGYGEITTVESPCTHSCEKCKSLDSGVKPPEKECTCPSVDGGELVHGKECPLYVEPECTCPPVDGGEPVHGKECPLYVEPECTCPPVDGGELIHGKECPLYVAPEMSEAVKALIIMVEALPEADAITGESKETTISAFEEAMMAYEELSNEDKAVFEATLQFAKLMALHAVLYPTALMVNDPVTLDISGENGYVNITATGYVVGSGEEVSYTGGYIITGEAAATSAQENHVMVSGGTHNITLKNTKIKLGQSGKCAFAVEGNSTVNLTLEGDNALESGFRRAGLEVNGGNTLTITEASTGSLTATANYGGAGIGGGIESGGGNITFAGGTVIANAWSGAAGIGGGSGGSGGSIIIRDNAVVFAAGGNYAPGHIGAGKDGTEGTVDKKGGIVFEGKIGFVYGTSVTPVPGFVIPENYVLSIGAGQTVTIGKGVTLQNNGIISNNGTINGEVLGNQPIIPNENEPDIGKGELVFTDECGSETCEGHKVTGITDKYKIVVQSGTHNITLDGVSIDMSTMSGACAFEIADGAAVNLTLTGNTTLKSGSDRAGLQVPLGATLVITPESQGTLTAIGGSDGAGIGNGPEGDAGSMTITGGIVTATGGRKGAGIGGGYRSGGGSVTISGNAVVFASGGSGAPFHIGVGGSTNPDGIILSINGGIVFEGRSGFVYGASVAPPIGFVIPENYVLSIGAGQTVTIGEGVVIQNNGIISNNGTINGKVLGNQPIMQNENEADISKGDFVFTNDCGNGTCVGHKVTGITDKYKIIVQSGTHDVTLDGASIDVSTKPDACGFEIAGGAAVNLTLAGNTTLKGGSNRAGLQVSNKATLVITAESQGTLIATGGTSGAGIGSSAGGTAGFITIRGGTVTATGGSGAAGIGSGEAGGMKDQKIAGGTVTATGGENAAGIGGGYRSSISSVILEGNAVVFATGGSNAPNHIGAGAEGTSLDVSKKCSILFEGKEGRVYRNFTVTNARTLEIKSEKTLTVPNGITLTNKGTIDNNGMIVNEGAINSIGTFSGNGAISGDGQVQSVLAANMIFFDKTAYAYTGSGITPIVTVASTPWTGSTTFTQDIDYTVECRENVNVGNGNVVVTSKNDKLTGVPVSKNFAIVRSDTAFTGGIKTYKNGTAQTVFTYGDTISVKVTPTATGTVPAAAGRAMTSPTANQMALFNGDEQLTEPLNVVNGTELTFTIDTSKKQLQIGKNNITAKYVAGSIMVDHEEDVEVTLKQKALTAALTGGSTASKTYDGTVTFTDVALTLGNGQVLSGDSITAKADGEVASAAVSTAKSFTVTAITLTGIGKDFYSLPTTAVTTGTVSITKASGLTATAPDHFSMEKKQEKEYTFDLSTIRLNKIDAGTKVYTLGKLTNDNSIFKKLPGIKGNQLTFTSNSIERPAADQATQVVTISSQNYEDTKVTLSFDITGKTPVAITGLEAAKNLVYNGAEQEGYAGTTEFIPSWTGALTYTYYEGVGINGKKLAGAPVNAGTYTVVASIPDNDTDFDGSHAPVTFTINQKEITVEQGSYKVTKSYDASISEGTGTGKLNTIGILPTDSVVSVIADTIPKYSDSAARPDYEIVLPISISGDTHGNYKLKKETVKVPGEITKASAVVTIEAITPHNYTGSPIKPDVTVRVESNIIADTNYAVEYGTNVDAGEDAGSVTVQEKVDGNYTFDDVTEHFKISKITYAGTSITGSKNVIQNTVASNIEFDLSSLTFPSGFKDRTFDSVAIGTNTDSLITGTPTISGTKIKFDVTSQPKGKTGVLNVTVRSKNYNDYTVAITVTTVEKSPVSVTGLTAATNLVYDGTAQKGYTGAVSVEGNKVSVSELVYTYTSTDGGSYNSITAPTNAGNYKLVVSVADSNMTYTGSHADILFTIGKATVIITAKDKKAYVGEAVPVLSASDYEITGLADGQRLETEPTLAYAVTPDMTKEGIVAIDVSGAVLPASPADANYNSAITYRSGKLTIGSKTSGGDSGGGNTDDNTGGSNTGGAGNNNGGNAGSDSTGGSTAGSGAVEADKSNKTEAKIEDKTIANAIKKAKKNAGKNDGSIELNVKTGKNATSLETTLSEDAIDALIQAGVTGLTIKNGLSTVTFDFTALKALSGGEMKLTISRIVPATLSPQAQKFIGNRPVYQYSITVGGKPVTDLKGGRAGLEIAYTKGENEQTGNLCGVFADGKGKITWLENSSYDPITGKQYISVTHFSIYGVGYKQTTEKFTDTASHWAKNDIDFVVTRGLLSGKSAATFAPDRSITRGMLVTALGKLEGIDTKKYENTKFTDVAAASVYAPYVAWADRNGIIAGTSETIFSPDTAVTRQELAVIMVNYSKATGYKLPNVHKEIIFADADSISSWAKDAVKQTQMAGILPGKRGNRFDPAAMATKAEVSAMLRRYVELTVNTETAQGLTMNESGEWMYIEDGKRFTGKKIVGGVAYTFDRYGVTTELVPFAN